MLENNYNEDDITPIYFSWGGMMTKTITRTASVGVDRIVVAVTEATTADTAAAAELAWRADTVAPD